MRLVVMGVGISVYQLDKTGCVGMRLGVVRGTVVLNHAVPSLVGVRLVILEPGDGGTAGGGRSRRREMSDCGGSAGAWGGTDGGFRGRADGDHAWYPDNLPVDAYCCLIVENVQYSPPAAAQAPTRQSGKKAMKKVHS